MKRLLSLIVSVTILSSGVVLGWPGDGLGAFGGLGGPLGGFGGYGGYGGFGAAGVGGVGLAPVGLGVVGGFGGGGKHGGPGGFGGFGGKHGRGGGALLVAPIQPQPVPVPVPTPAPMVTTQTEVLPTTYNQPIVAPAQVTVPQTNAPIVIPQKSHIQKDIIQPVVQRVIQPVVSQTIQPYVNQPYSVINPVLRPMVSTVTEMAPSAYTTPVFQQGTPIAPIMNALRTEAPIAAPPGAFGVSPYETGYPTTSPYGASPYGSMPYPLGGVAGSPFGGAGPLSGAGPFGGAGLPGGPGMGYGPAGGNLGGSPYQGDMSGSMLGPQLQGQDMSQYGMPQGGIDQSQFGQPLQYGQPMGQELQMGQPTSMNLQGMGQDDFNNLMQQPTMTTQGAGIPFQHPGFGAQGGNIAMNYPSTMGGVSTGKK